MNIIIPTYITDDSKTGLILDQIYVTIESYYSHGNQGDFLVYTNSSAIVAGLCRYNEVFQRDVKSIKINFEKEWKQLNLPISDTRTRKSFIISKMLIPFIFDDDFLLLDWDILTTGYIPHDVLKSDKLRLFNPKFYDGYSLRQNSFYKGLSPEANIGNNKWLNSGMVFSPKGLARQLITEYWDKFDSITEQVYKNIFLHDIIDDELIYNIMILDGDTRVEEYTKHNINIVLRTFYYDFSNISSMYNFGKDFPNILNIHFSAGHIKPYDVIIDDSGKLHFPIEIEKYAIDSATVKWLFDMSQHRMGSFHLNALMFSIIWQYTRYIIKEKLESKPASLSSRYLDFFNRIFLK
jgi:hypothetical protein